jgi:hypothetical protein
MYSLVSKTLNNLACNSNGISPISSKIKYRHSPLQSFFCLLKAPDLFVSKQFTFEFPCWKYYNSMLQRIFLPDCYFHEWNGFFSVRFLPLKYSKSVLATFWQINYLFQCFWFSYNPIKGIFIGNSLF